MATILTRRGARILCIHSLLAAATAHGAPSAKPVVVPEPVTTVIVRMGVRGRQGVTEHRYQIDIGAQRAQQETKLETPADDRSDFDQRRSDEWQRNAAVYERIRRFESELKASEQNPQLGAALRDIERVIKAGHAYRHPIAASPDGAKAVYSWPSAPLLLIDSNNLATRLLGNSEGPSVWPVAWAPDSRAFALPAPTPVGIQIYDASGQVVMAKKKGPSSWVTALSWSPDARYIAVCELANRRQNKTILGRLAGAAGHPEFWNDAVLHVFEASEDKHFSLVLKREISEWGWREFRIEWH